MSSAFQDSSDVAAARQQIDNEINAQLTILLNLKTRRNALAHVNRLPPELLSEIFRYTQSEGDPIEEHDALRGLGSRQQLVLSWVCHYWRAVALNTLDLWNLVDLRYLTLARQCMLPRIKEAPFHIKSRQWDKAQSSLFRELFPQLHRIHSIDIEFHSRAGMDGPIPLPRGASSLRSLRIRNASLSLTDLPTIFSHSRFPQIRELELDQYLGNIPECLFGPTLRSLSLTTVPVHANRVSCVSVFLRRLSRMPKLEFLRIGGIKLTWKTPVQNAVSLPELSTILLTPLYRDTFRYLELLERLRFPLTAHCNLNFGVSLDDDGPETFQELLRRIATYFTPAVFRSASLLAREGGFTVTIWLESLDQDDTIPKLTPSTSRLCLHLPPQVQRASYLWDEFLRSVQPHNLTFLHLEGLSRSEETYQTFLAQCHNLRWLSLKGVCAYTIVYVMDELIEIPHSEDRVPIMPKLNTLQLGHVPWHPEPEDDTIRRAGYNDGSFVPLLTRILSMRWIAEYPLDSVVITSCTLVGLEDALRILDDVTSNVRLDGSVYERADYLSD